MIQIEIPEDSKLIVEAGDHFGFTWLDNGVVVYDEVGTDNFCEESVSEFVILGKILKQNMRTLTFSHIFLLLLFVVAFNLVW